MPDPIILKICFLLYFAFEDTQDHILEGQISLSGAASPLGLLLSVAMDFSGDCGLLFSHFY